MNEWLIGFVFFEIVVILCLWVVNECLKGEEE